MLFFAAEPNFSHFFCGENCEKSHFFSHSGRVFSGKNDRKNNPMQYNTIFFHVIFQYPKSLTTECQTTSFAPNFWALFFDAFFPFGMIELWIKNKRDREDGNDEKKCVKTRNLGLEISTLQFPGGFRNIAHCLFCLEPHLEVGR